MAHFGASAAIVMRQCKWVACLAPRAWYNPEIRKENESFEPSLP
jgi:hypothetical protein